MPPTRLPAYVKKSQGSCPGPWLWGWAHDFLLCACAAQPSLDSPPRSWAVVPGAITSRLSQHKLKLCTPSHSVWLWTGPGALSQLKLRYVLESCSSSSCSNPNSLLVKVWCLTRTYLRYLLKHALRAIPVAVDFTQRSFYFISFKEIKGKNLISISVERYIKLYFSQKVILSAASGAEAVNPLMY